MVPVPGGWICLSLVTLWPFMEHREMADMSKTSHGLIFAEITGGHWNLHVHLWLLLSFLLVIESSFKEEPFPFYVRLPHIFAPVIRDTVKPRKSCKMIIKISINIKITTWAEKEPMLSIQLPWLFPAFASRRMLVIFPSQLHLVCTYQWCLLCRRELLL